VGAFFPLKTRHLLAVLLAVGLTLVGRAAGPEIQCTGVLVAGSETKVALAHAGAGPAQWIPVGGEFDGYTVSSYESASDTVILTKGGEKFRVRLQDAKVMAGAIEPPPEVKRGILNNLRQLGAAADQYYLENGKSEVTLSDLVGPAKYIKRLQPLAGEDYSQIKFEQGKPISVTTAGGYTITHQP
jgi:hypothetical protein